MKNYINEVSKLFNIPKSTLRYWDEEGLIFFDRDESNGYRTVSTRSIYSIGDIALHRGMGISVKELKNFYNMQPADMESLYLTGKKSLEAELAELKNRQKAIEGRLRHFETYRELLSSPYSFSPPPFSSLRVFDIESYEDTVDFFMKESAAALYIDKNAAVPALVSDRGGGLWERSEKRYVRCLIKYPFQSLVEEPLNEHIAYLKKQGFETGCAVAYYLFTACEDECCDYYEAWLEER